MGWIKTFATDRQFFLCFIKSVLQNAHVLISWPNEAVLCYHKEDIRVNRHVWVRLTYSIIRKSKLWMYKGTASRKIASTWCKGLHSWVIWSVFRDCSNDLYPFCIVLLGEKKSQNIIMSCNFEENTVLKAVCFLGRLLLLDNTGKKKSIRQKYKNGGTGWWK